MATAIQLQAGFGEYTDTVVDEVRLLLQNGLVSDESFKQALKKVKDYLDALDVEVCQPEKWCEPVPPIQITDLFDSADGNNATSIVARYALGFGDMWSKGLSFMGLMYVTLSTAISNLAEHLKQAAGKQLTLGIENLDGEVEQMEIFKFKRSVVRYEPVNGVCDNLSQLGYDLDSLNQMVSGMNGKKMASDEKQDPTNLGVWHLCNKADGLKISGKAQKGKTMKSDEKQDPTNLGVLLLYNEADGRKISGKAQGPKALADNSFPEDGSVKYDNQPRWLTSYPGMVTRRNMVMKQFLKETEDNAKSCNRNYNLH